MANYPNSDPSFTTKSAGQSIEPSHVNDLQDEVVAIGSALRGTLQHAVTVGSGGLTVQSGGVTVSSGGLTVSSGGVTVSTGGVSVAGASSFAGAVTFGGDLVLGAAAPTIRQDTSDGADSALVTLAGGGSGAQSRGALIQVYGNEHATQPGNVAIFPGNVGGGSIDFYNSAGSIATVMDGGGIWSNLVQVLDRDVTAVAVSNTITETTVYTFSVPAGVMGTTRALRLTFAGTVVNTEGTGNNTNIEINFGGSDFVSQSLSFNNATTNEISVVAIIANMNSASAQRFNARLSHAHTAGGTAWTAATDWVAASAGTVDTSQAQNLIIKITHDTASVNYTYTHRYTLLELI